MHGLKAMPFHHHFLRCSLWRSELSALQYPLPTHPCHYMLPFQGDVLICMEMMDRSLHDLYKLVYDKLHLHIPDNVVGRMSESVSPAISVGVHNYGGNTCFYRH